jgi:hypothetical protein
VKREFCGVSRIFPIRFESLSNSNRIQMKFASKIYNSKSREILNLGQRGKLCHLNLSISMPGLENVEQKGDLGLCFPV